MNSLIPSKHHATSVHMAANRTEKGDTERTKDNVDCTMRQAYSVTMDVETMHGAYFQQNVNNARTLKILFTLASHTWCHGVRVRVSL